MPSLFYSQPSLQLPTNFPLSEGLTLTFNLVVNRALSTSSPLVSSPARPAAHVSHPKTPPETRAFSRRCQAPQNTVKTAPGHPEATADSTSPAGESTPGPGGAAQEVLLPGGHHFMPRLASPGLAWPGRGSPAGCRPPRSNLPAGSLWGDAGGCLQAEARKKGGLSPLLLTKTAWSASSAGWGRVSQAPPRHDMAARGGAAAGQPAGSGALLLPGAEWRDPPLALAGR